MGTPGFCVFAKIRGLKYRTAATLVHEHSLYLTHISRTPIYHTELSEGPGGSIALLPGPVNGLQHLNCPGAVRDGSYTVDVDIPILVLTVMIWGDPSREDTSRNITQWTLGLFSTYSITNNLLSRT